MADDPARPKDLITSRLVRDAEAFRLPRDRMPDIGVDGDVAFDLITNDLLLDGRARLNLATFVTTAMPPMARELMDATADKNMIDKDEYPQTAAFEQHCTKILARLWHAEDPTDPTGCSTIGSSEASMLGGMALKWRWRKRREAAGQEAAKPNLVLGTNVQVCWEKFCRYWEVEPRWVPMEGDTYHLTPERAAAACDENSIGVVAILGSTFDGSYEPVAEIAAALDDLAAGGGPDVPIHVDAASGGFVAPFIQPDLVWDFQVPRVQSINASGHKYGLVYPGVGWALWRNAEALPEELVFKVDYLGGNMPTFALNFSRPGSEVLAQYFMFLSLGRKGYEVVQRTSQEVAMKISAGVAKLGPFELLTDGSELPVFAFKLRDDVRNYTVYDVSARLRESGWLVPAYAFPDNRTDLSALRVVVRAGMTFDMADLLLDALGGVTRDLESLDAPLPDAPAHRREAFHH